MAVTELKVRNVNSRFWLKWSGTKQADSFEFLKIMIIVQKDFMIETTFCLKIAFILGVFFLCECPVGGTNSWKPGDLLRAVCFNSMQNTGLLKVIA